jgi:squalene-hopene cyclase-like protein
VSHSEAVQRGIRFLKQRLQSGQYGLSCCGFDGTPRVSNNKGHLFSGFFIAEAICSELDEIERSLLLVRLLSEESNGHWGYAPRALWDGPPDNPFYVDADDTAFALRLMRRLGLYRSPQVLKVYRRQGRRLLRRESGFVTFNSEKTPSLCFDPHSTRNFDMHPEVNANVFLALVRTNYCSWISRDIVTRSQTSDGYWRSFFYPGRFYSTWMFMDLIGQLGGFDQEREKGIGFLTRSQNPDGSWGEGSGPLETAYAIKGLRCVGAGGKTVTRGREFLVGNQREDGSWASDSIIWEFHESSNDVWQAKDVNHVVTTALCVDALAREPELPDA